MIAVDPILTKKPVTLLEIVEGDPMDTEMVTVGAEAMGKGIDAQGHIALYGIYFDTDSATLKPESDWTIGEIARLLTARSDLNLWVVGHTDHQGVYEYNMDLSHRRAEAVVTALASKHGIDPGRLQAAGVGYLAPVATNDSPGGRQKNRRVVLVKD